LACTYDDYDHFWVGWGIELTEPTSVLSKNVLSGLLAFFITGGWGFLAGVLAGCILSLFIDNTFAILASDADTPLVTEPRMDMLVSSKYSPSVGDGYGVGTYSGHFGKDPVFFTGPIYPS
jgi:hypothetical protein